MENSTGAPAHTWVVWVSALCPRLLRYTVAILSTLFKSSFKLLVLHVLPWKHNVFPCTSIPVFGSMSLIFRHWPSIILGESVNAFLVLAPITYNCLMICKVCTCILFNSVTTLLTRYHPHWGSKVPGPPAAAPDTTWGLRLLFTHSYCFLVSSHSAQWSRIKLHWWPSILYCWVGPCSK